ncbi:hypothetical protein HY375_00890 [Candidatus Berkelbacteria bacterium]|nr:hypothetical protein [Candidatus Berkelbacteria bacterium]
MIKSHNESGSALLITLIVVAAIGTISFAAARGALSGLQQQLRLEDGANAYQAALAGIEDGLLRWRHSRQIEVPAQATTGSCAAHPVTSSPFVDRIDLTTGTVQPCLNPAQASAPPTDHVVYDLKLWFRLDPAQPEIVDSVVRSGGIEPALAQDQAVEYTVDQAVREGRVLLKVTPQSGVIDPGDLLEVIATNHAGTETRSLLSETELLARGFLSGRTALTELASDTQQIRFKYFGQALTRYELAASAETPLGSRQSVIESTGYFGGAKQKLSLNLDRMSGELREPFDFLLFSGEGDLRPE